MELQSGNIPFLIYLYRDPIGDKEPDGGNRKHNVKSQQDILFHRDKQIGEQHDPHNDPRGRAAEAAPLAFLRMKTFHDIPATFHYIGVASPLSFC